jgi:hypothetical protein
LRLRRTGMDRAQYEGGLWRGGSSIVAFCCPGDEIIICDNRSACRSIAVYARTTHARQQPSLVGFPLLLLLTACCCTTTTTTTTIPHAAASANAACNACVPLMQAGVFCVVVFCASVKSSTRNYETTHGLPCTTENMAAPGPPRSLSTCRHFT